MKKLSMAIAVMMFAALAFANGPDPCVTRYALRVTGIRVRNA
jgi:hypothetical protein